LTTGVITTSFPRHAGDFAGCFVEDAARACALAGEIVDVIAAGVPPRFWLGCRSGRNLGEVPLESSPDDRRDDRPDLVPGIRVTRIRTPVTPDIPSLFFASGAPEMLEKGGLSVWLQAGMFWAALCEHVRERAPTWDRIVAHWLVPSALVAREVAPWLSLTAYAHSGDVALLERIPAGAALGRLIARRTDDLIFVSADLRERFNRLTGIVAGRVARLTPIRTTRAQGSRTQSAVHRREARSALGVSRWTLLSVGRLVPIKGFDILLRAVAKAATQRRAGDSDLMTTVVILGDGPERPRLATLARRNDIDLRLPGFVARTEVARWMLAADLYVQPSRQLPTGRTEGLPIATLEAINAGLPVIASDSGGLGELAGCGVRIVPPDNVSALCDLLLDLAEQTSNGNT
jgi:glycosyltransferase involved in cell wall biosynthesis